MNSGKKVYIFIGSGWKNEFKVRSKKKLRLKSFLGSCWFKSSPSLSKDLFIRSWGLSYDVLDSEVLLNLNKFQVV